MLKPLRYIEMINKYYLIPYHLHMLETKGNIKEILLGIEMMGYDKMFDDRYFKKGVTPEQKKKFKIEAFRKIEEYHKKNVDEYIPILLNQALVMACSVFESFLIDVIDEIVRTHEKIIRIVACETRLTRSETDIIARENEVPGLLKSKILKSFHYSGIKNKIKILSKVGLKREKTITLIEFTDEIQQKYPDPYAYLLETYSMRHKIVHQDVHSIKHLDELQDRTLFLGKIVLQYTLMASSILGITNELQQYPSD